jgi:hypothetical protein
MYLRKKSTKFNLNRLSFTEVMVKNRCCEGSKVHGDKRMDREADALLSESTGQQIWLLDCENILTLITLQRTVF